MRSYYEELEVDSSASADDICVAFRRLAKKYHPDLNIGREQEVRAAFIRVQRAFEILSDPERRARYDAHYDRRNPWGQPTPPSVYEIQPLDEFQIDRSSLETAVNLPRIRRRLDPQLRKAILFIAVCIVVAVLVVIITT
ncbi:MAG TPA: DnaJ domain-containing protein [Pirellulales bacterium]|nr:DnaJ domain-containing protein [Pirellulales bacterium]